jgi:hypothetical protein
MSVGIGRGVAGYVGFFYSVASHKVTEKPLLKNNQATETETETETET